MTSGRASRVDTIELTMREMLDRCSARRASLEIFLPTTNFLRHVRWINIVTLSTVILIHTRAWSADHASCTAVIFLSPFPSKMVRQGGMFSSSRCCTVDNHPSTPRKGAHTTTVSKKATAIHCNTEIDSLHIFIYRYNIYPQWRVHYSDVIMSAMASQITRLTIVYSTVYSGADQRKY